MGASASSVDVILQDAAVQLLFDSYQYPPSCLLTLHSLYTELSSRHNGEVLVSHLGEYFKEENNWFLTRLFLSFSIDITLPLTFPTFLSVLSEFCCFSEPQMVDFSFRCFDVDNSGHISENEIKTFIDDMEKSASDFPKAAKKALEIFDSDGSGDIDLDEFSEMNLRYPHLLWPAFRLQNRVMEGTIGIKKWKKIHQKMKEKGKTQKLYGPRPYCVGCICLARPVINLKKSKTLHGGQAGGNPLSRVHTQRGGRKASVASVRNRRMSVQSSALASRRGSNVVVPIGGRKLSSFQEGEEEEKGGGKGTGMISVKNHNGTATTKNRRMSAVVGGGKGKGTASLRAPKGSGRNRSASVGTQLPGQMANEDEDED